MSALQTAVSVSAGAGQRGLAVLALNPDAVHCQLLPSVHLQPTVHQVLNLFQSRSREQCVQLILCEEVNSSAVTSHIEVVRQTLTFLKPKLSHVMAAIISQKYHTSRLQKSAKPVNGVLHLIWNNRGEHKYEDDDIQSILRYWVALLFITQVMDKGKTP